MLAELRSKVGVPPVWRNEVWPLFEQAVLDLIAEGCRRLQSDRRRDASWRERHFSWALNEHLEAICREHDSPLSPRDERRLLDANGFADGDDPDQAPRIDLVVRYHNVPSDVYFGIEAKILVDKCIGNYSPKRTVIEYVEEGMKRYVDDKYASHLPCGAMVGYVLSGKFPELVKEINEAISETKLPYEQLLKGCNIAGEFHTHDSRHPRSSTSICLSHFFVVFTDPSSN
jgi:hypothetical protein